jgi:hypothetical protein
MRTIVCLVLLAFFQPAIGQTPQDWINRATSAHGGANALAQMKAFAVVANGKINISGTDVVATREGKLALPDRLLWTVTFKYNGIDRKSVIALNGLSGWQQINQRQPGDMDSTIYDENAEEAYAFSLTTLTPLSQKGFTFAAAPDVTVNGKPAAGVKVSRAGKPDVVLCFSKADALLVKAQFAGKSAGVPTNKEFVYSEHKPFGGVKLPTKIIDMRDGVRIGEWTVTDYRFVDKFGAEEFKKPKAK